ncbi:MAG: alpha/beta fold hydrolase [Thermofilaceae archaeon]|nr:alpha/beta fold hydrolase [Thermofilaceae archaeon]MCX8180015.1 alpha/beta fold hydrolase [Thermofilaceae archaeon]MDW8003242.1 alpha/beta fold hydrolase [Thermofilaceae archaeon]
MKQAREEFVRIPSAGLHLAGVLHVPLGVVRPKPVLFLHGFTGNKSEAGRLYTDMARFLCASGYAALRFDFRCHGDSPLPFEEYKISYALEDARNAANFLKTLSEVDASKFAVIGLSMGGGVAVNLTAGRDDVAALVLLAPALDWPELAGRATPKIEGGYVYLGGLRMKVENAAETMQFSVMNLAEQIKAPTLIVHSTDDEVVPISQSKKFYENLKVEKKLLEVNGGHVFNDYQVRRQIEQEVLSWIKTHF